jgi:hypothetical protein
MRLQNRNRLGRTFKAALAAAVLARIDTGTRRATSASCDYEREAQPRSTGSVTQCSNVRSTRTFW